MIEAKGKDKRGNGTAAATVTLTMAAADAGTGTEVRVATDLAITGKPAQFGRGVMQDVSDKLLGQFVACLEQRLTPSPEVSAPEESAPEESAAEPAAAGPVAPVPPAKPAAAPADSGDAVDLGATVLPVLLKTYGRQVAAAVLGLLIVGWLVRRLLR